MIYYHATPKDNVFNITANGLKRGIDGFTYLCKSEEDCLKFFYTPSRFSKVIDEPKQNNKWEIKNGIKSRIISKYIMLDKIEIAVIPIDLDESTVFESTDHNAEYIKAAAFYIDYDIPKEKIPFLKDIKLYELQNPFIK